MRCEWPAFQRCCFCLPLRYGLIGVGYSTMVVNIVMITFMMLNRIDRMMAQNRHIMWTVFLAAIFLYYIADTVSQILLIIGGHKKNHSILRIFYRYSVLLLALTVMSSLSLVVLDIVIMYKSPLIWILSFSRFIFVFTASCLSVILQVYKISLISSEIKKLENDLEYQFTNESAASCVTTEPRERNGKLYQPHTSGVNFENIEE